MKERSKAFLKNEELYRESVQGLGRWLDQWRTSKVNPDYQGHWKETRNEHINKHGDDSIYTLLPPVYNLGHAPASRALTAFQRHEVHTKDELLMQEPDDFRFENQAGDKTVEFIERLQEIALAEFHLKWS